MAILKNLLVTGGASRFLGSIYCQDISVSGSATLSSLSLSGDLSVTGTSTLTGHVSVGGYNNTLYGLSANSAIINNWIRTVGSTGWYNESHGGGWWMKDNDYVRSYGKPVLMDHNMYFGTAGDTGYYVKTTGAAKFASVVAPAATISTVNATNLSVSNNLRATHFDLQTVAQLGGSFYVSPTVKFPNSGTTLKVEKSGSTLTLTITDSSITSTTMAGIVWSANSHVKVSGTINGVVTGTMDGTVSSINTSSHVLTLSVSGENSASVVAGTYSASQFSNLTVMIYQRRDGSNDYRVGIWMNCYDVVNSSSTIRIYGGSDTNPNVMLGNLTSAGLGTVNNLTPTGWGLFAQNAFLHGKVVANGGLIGNWTIGTTGMYYNSDAPSSTSITMIPGGTTASTTSIGGSSGSKSWIFTGKDLFGIDTTGKLYASSAEISGKITATSGSIAGWAIGSNFLHKDISGYRVGLYAPTSPTANNAAFYIATYDGTKETAYPFYIKYSGKLYAEDADIKGKVTATSGYIGGTSGWTIASQQLSNGTLGADNSLYLGTKNLGSDTSIGGRQGSDWRLTVGQYFGVTNTGTLYANAAVISGNITATSGSIAGWRIESTYLASGTATAPAANTLLLSPAGTFSSYTVAGTAKSGWMITAGTTFGVNKDGGVYAASGKIGPWNITATSIYKGANTLGSTTSGAAYFGNLGLSIGNKFKVDASGNGAIILGELAEGKTHVEVDSDSFDVCVGSGTGSNSDSIASFGENIRLGREEGEAHVVITGQGLDFRDSRDNSVSSVNVFNTLDRTTTVSKSSSSSDYQGSAFYINFSTEHGFIRQANRVTRNGVVIPPETYWVNSSRNYLFFSANSGLSNGDTVTVNYEPENKPVMACFGSPGSSSSQQGRYSFYSGLEGCATGLYSHAEGRWTEATGKSAHAEGDNTVASGKCSHAEGVATRARGDESHAQNQGTVAQKTAQTVLGTWNVYEEESSVEGTHPSGSFTYGKYAVIIGNGTDTTNRSNCLTVDWQGNVVASGTFNNFKINTSSTDFDVNNFSNANGLYIASREFIGAPTTNHGAVIDIKSVGTPFQMFFPDNQLYVYKRYFTGGSWTGWSYMTATAISSSRKIKENIKPMLLEEAKKVLDLQVVSFDYKESFSGEKNQFGLIAEDVEKIIPFMVSRPKDENLKADINLGVDYTKAVPYLIKVIQQQQKDINNLKNTIKKMGNI